jgi:hypothetical protein
MASEIVAMEPCNRERSFYVATTQGIVSKFASRVSMYTFMVFCMAQAFTLPQPGNDFMKLRFDQKNSITITDELSSIPRIHSNIYFTIMKKSFALMALKKQRDIIFFTFDTFEVYPYLSAKKD